LFNPYSSNIFWNRFGLDYHRRFRPFRKFKINSFIVGSVFFFQFGQRSGIKGTDGTGFDAVRLLAVQVSIKTKIALAHFSVIFRPELRRIVRAGFQTFDITFCPAKTSVAVYQHDAVIRALGYGIYRAGSGTQRFGTVPAGGNHIADERFRKFAFFSVEHPHPVFRPGRNVVPVLASHTAGTATGASGLIEVESYLHGMFSVLF
jgi:hypothetical protein